MKTVNEVIEKLGKEVFSNKMSGCSNSYSSIYGQVEMAAFIYGIEEDKIYALVDQKAEEVRANTFKGA